MKKFFKKKNKGININQYKGSSIEGLNQKYDEIIDGYTKGLFVNPNTGDLSTNLESMQMAVETRLDELKNKVREYEQKYNESIVNGTKFDIDLFTKIKSECIRLESLYNTINERLGAMKETIGKKL